MMIRSATTSDISQIKNVLNEADLRFTSETFDGFRLAEIDGKLVGIVRLEEHPDFLFLTSLGVATAYQKQGIASALMSSIIAEAKKPIYLYTIIPDFFIRFGFSPSPHPSISPSPHPSISPSLHHPITLPPKAPYGCNECVPGECVTMVKYPGDTKVS